MRSWLWTVHWTVHIRLSRKIGSGPHPVEQSVLCSHSSYKLPSLTRKTRMLEDILSDEVEVQPALTPALYGTLYGGPSSSARDLCLARGRARIRAHQKRQRTLLLANFQSAVESLSLSSASDYVLFVPSGPLFTAPHVEKPFSSSAFSRCKYQIKLVQGSIDGMEGHLECLVPFVLQRDELAASLNNAKKRMSLELDPRNGTVENQAPAQTVELQMAKIGTLKTKQWDSLICFLTKSIAPT